MDARPRSAAKRSVLRRALPRTKNGIFFSSFSASGVQGFWAAVTPAAGVGAADGEEDSNGVEAEDCDTATGAEAEDGGDEA